MNIPELTEIREMRNELKKKIEAVGKDALSKAFTRFFEANPKVEAIRWRQYTPYFNDGEPCEFSVDDLYAKKAGDDEPGDYGDGFYFPEWSDKSAEAESFRAFKRAVVDDDLFLAVFGDHVEVTATRAGFDVEEYSHD
jgi:hypothetical protein